ncbi:MULTISPECIES: N-acetyl sugar amidotransferase [Spirulina sp. CCY15215]|uniref:N-acetyl sugar amidotransferase n=1 Tax=Spirulina sp. CCY15215 TaxID=2767591 RepID=UPI0019513406
MKFCQKCAEPDTRPDCIFDEEGICLPCRYAETIDEIDWASRRQEIAEIAEWGKQHSKSGYDCIIGVSGGKDSHRQSLYARDELGLKPLLVSCAYPPDQQTERGAANLANLVDLGFDTIVVGPAPKNWKALMRHGFLKFGNWCKSTELALYASVPRIAVAYNIPLIFLGENPALSWGSAGGSLDGNANRMKYNNTLKGGDIKPLLEAQGIEEKDLYWYRYPSDEEMERTNLRLVYLGYYIRDFNDYVNSRIAIEHGMQIREGQDAIPEDMGQINNFDALDDDFIHVNQMLKYFKFGFGKVTEQVSGAIRNGMMTREEGLELVRKYDGKCADRYIKAFCNYIEVSEDLFWEVTESYRNLDLWERDDLGNWQLKYKIQ